MILSEVELLFMRKLVVGRLDQLLVDIRYQNNLSNRGKDVMEKLALLEAEYNNLLRIKDKINDSIALNRLREV